jgi:peptidoglycan/LPS O-acetylase OafA/YrhL
MFLTKPSKTDAIPVNLEQGEIIKPVNRLEYLPGLDGIRAIAIILVISVHWPNLMYSLKFGWIGVNIFFVLSGFLITRILLHEKQKPFKPYLKNFFLKRALRIFPVYYLYFGICVIVILVIYYFIPPLSDNQITIDAVNTLKYDSGFYLTYTYNIKQNLSLILDLKRYNSLFFAHVWSLAIEEQFYLIFPFVVYFLNRAQLKRTVIAIIIICALLRLWAATIGIHTFSDRYFLGQFFYVNTVCQADALAFGAALAIFPIEIKFPYRTFFIMLFIFLLVGFTCLFFLRKAGYFFIEGNSIGFDFPGFWFIEPTPWFLIKIRAFYQGTLVNLLAFFLIAPATIQKPLFPAILQSKPLSYLGKISYGVYLFHYPVLGLFKLVISLFGDWYKVTAPPLIDTGILILYLVIVVSLAHLSYQYFERKINRYRHKFNG